MTGYDPLNESINYDEIILERMRYAQQQVMSAEMVHHFVTRAERVNLLGDMYLRVEREVLAHKLLADEVVVPVRGRLEMFEPPMDVLVELPRGFWRRLFRRPPRHRWLPVVGHAALNPPVEGTAIIRAEYFHTFPEDTTRYPEHMGSVRQVIQRSDPFNIHFRER